MNWKYIVVITRKKTSNSITFKLRLLPLFSRIYFLIYLLGYIKQSKNESTCVETVHSNWLLNHTQCCILTMLKLVANHAISFALNSVTYRNSVIYSNCICIRTTICVAWPLGQVQTKLMYARHSQGVCFPQSEVNLTKSAYGYSGGHVSRLAILPPYCPTCPWNNFSFSKLSE